MLIHNYHDLFKIKRLSLRYSSNVLNNFLCYDDLLKFMNGCNDPLWFEIGWTNQSQLSLLFAIVIQRQKNPGWYPHPPHFRKR